MTAQLGSDEEHEIGTPLPRLLREVSGLQPERDEEHVGLDLAGVVSMQRLRIGDVGGGVTAAVWPAEPRRRLSICTSTGAPNASSARHGPSAGR